MQKLVIRHGEKEVRPPEEGEEPNNNPLITWEAVLEAWMLGIKLRRDGVDTSSIATSELLRTRHTALALQGKDGILKAPHNPAYSLLNEVHCEIPDNLLYAMLARGEVPQEVLDAAQHIRLYPPPQKLLLTHELTSTGLTALAVCQGFVGRLNPECLEVRSLEFPDASDYSEDVLVIGSAPVGWTPSAQNTIDEN